MLSGVKQSAFAWQLRRTRLYNMWRKYRAPEQWRLAARERAFYREFLGSRHDLAILDIGANVGSKTEIFRELATRVVAVEPDPDLGALLERRFAGDDRVTIAHSAVAAEHGMLEFFKFEGSEAFNTASTEWAAFLQAPNSRFGAQRPPQTIRVPAVTLAELLQRYRPIHFTKIDVEGLEWSVLSTLAEPISAISLEFNLPDFWQDLVRSVEFLVKLDPRYRFNGVITEPPQRFESERWLDADAFMGLVAQRAWNYVEVYARTS